jgi:5-(hydroxymethyl)furfural/furfural oxidase
VAELLFEGRRCVGVVAYVKGARREFKAREVILSCGAIHSPAHLLRAGIGPVGHLKSLGIEVRAGLEGVGQRLMDHPSISVSAYVRPEARINEFTRRHIHVGLRYSSGLPGMHEGDMFVVAVTKSAWHAVGDRIASFLIAVYHTASERGQVKLASRDWRDEPEVEFNLLSDRRDLERLMQAFRKMGALYATPAMQAATSDPFPASYTDRVRRIGVVNAKNKILTRIAGTLLDGPAALRSYLIRNLITEAGAIEDVMADDEALEAFVRKATIGVWHASCSCRMGADGDPMAVTDPEGRVRGVAGLRVVDASIFPLVPCANTNFPTLMAAEKIADAILA